jgi:hypothetical protein
VDKVEARHALGDQRRSQADEYSGENPSRIGEVRVDREAFGRQAGILANRGVLARGRGHDRDRPPVVGRDQAAMAAVAQALQRGRADPGILEAGRQLRPHLAGRGMLTSDQRTSALDGGPVQIIDNQRQDDPR